MRWSLIWRGKKLNFPFGAQHRREKNHKEKIPRSDVTGALDVRHKDFPPTRTSTLQSCTEPRQCQDERDWWPSFCQCRGALRAAETLTWPDSVGIFRPWLVDLWKGSKKISKESRMGQTCQTHSDQGKTFQKQKQTKKIQEGAACHLRMFTHTQKNLRQTLLTLSRWTGEGRRLLQVLFLDYHQTKTLNNADKNFF